MFHAITFAQKTIAKTLSVKSGIEAGTNKLLGERISSKTLNWKREFCYRVNSVQKHLKSLELRHKHNVEITGVAGYFKGE